MDLLNKIDDIEWRFAETVSQSHAKVFDIMPMLELGLIRKELTRIADHLETIAKTEVLKADEDGYGKYE